MSDEKTYTEREKVMAERGAYQRGVYALHLEPEIPGGIATGAARDRVLSQVTKEYPLPKVTRPRVVKDWDREFRIYKDQMQTRHADEIGGKWVCIETSGAVVTDEGLALRVTPTRVKLWADLLANPTEEVDAE